MSDQIIYPIGYVDPNAVPYSVSMRQARLALLQSGHLSLIDAAIEQLHHHKKKLRKLHGNMQLKLEETTNSFLFLVGYLD